MVRYHTGDRILSQAGSRLPVETPSQRDPAAAHEGRGVDVYAGFVYMEIWAVITRLH
jgi:hypothetical protein